MAKQNKVKKKKKKKTKQKKVERTIWQLGPIKKDTKGDIDNIDNIDNIENKISDIKLFDIEGKFLHIRVGDTQRPIDDKEIQEVTAQIDDLLKNNGVKNCIIYVSHHAIFIDVVK
jgi:hypothetical protein